MAECGFEDILSQTQHQLDLFFKDPFLFRKENYCCQNLSCNLNYHYKWNASVKDDSFFSDSKFSQELFLWKKKQSIDIAEFPDMLSIVGNVCVFFFTL